MLNQNDTSASTVSRGGWGRRLLVTSAIGRGCAGSLTTPAFGTTP